MTVGIYSFQVGAGPFGAIVVGFVAGSTTLVAGQFAFSVARSPIVRLVVGLLFALPAACAGYDVTLAFAHIPSEWWRAAFAVVGAITVGGTAWARMSISEEPRFSRSGVAPVPPQPSTAHWSSRHEQVTLRLHRLFVWGRRGNRSSA